MKGNHIRIAGIAFWALISIGGAAAQGSEQRRSDERKGEIQLWVVDPQGAVIANAQVKLSDDSKMLVSQVTAYDGSLTLPDLAAGSYVVEISSRGFQTYKDSVSVKSGSTTRLDVTLKVGESGWWTGPTAEPPLVDTGEPVAPTQIDSKPVQPVPANPKHTNPFKRFFKKLFHR